MYPEYISGTCQVIQTNVDDNFKHPHHSFDFLHEWSKDCDWVTRYNVTQSHSKINGLRHSLANIALQMIT